MNFRNRQVEEWGESETNFLIEQSKNGDTPRPVLAHDNPLPKYI